MRRFGQCCVAVVAVILTCVAGVEASEPPQEGPTFGSVTAQTSVTVGLTAGTVAVGTGLSSYLLHPRPGGTFAEGFLFTIPVGSAGLSVLTLSPLVPFGVAQATGALSDIRQLHLLGTAAGTLVGGVLGAGGAVWMARQAGDRYREGRWGLHWLDNRWPTAAVVSLPFAVGMGLGAVGGYFLEHHFTEQRQDQDGGEASFYPTVGPVGAGGWSLGATVRF